MELRHLRLINTLAQAGTLTAAGKLLNLSQSALSHQLREIEEELGAPLFQRLGKRMVLTQIGRRMLDGADAILGELRRAKDDVKMMVAGAVGMLRVATACYTCYHWLPCLLKGFKKAYPGIDVRIHADATSHPSEALLKGELDLAIVTKKIAHANLHYEPLFEDEELVLIRKEHPWASKEYVSPQDFADSTLIVYDNVVEESALFSQVLLPENVTPGTLIKLPLTDAIVEMVKASLGVAVLAQWAITPHLRNSGLVTRPLTETGLKRQWYAVTAEDRHLPAHIRGFVDYVKDCPPAGRSVSFR